MDFHIMGFHIVDIVIVALVAFLAIKGLVNGFSKELLNFITVVVGVTLAARYNIAIVDLINKEQLVPTIPDQFAKIVGFILIILSIWLLIGLISSVVSRFTNGPSGILSRVSGYILSAARYVFIFSLIIFGVSQSDFFAKSATKFTTETQLFQPMSEIGMKILNVDLNETITETIKEQLDANKSEIKDVNITVTPSTKPSSTTLTEPNENNDSNVSNY